MKLKSHNKALYSLKQYKVLSKASQGNYGAKLVTTAKAAY